MPAWPALCADPVAAGPCTPLPPDRETMNLVNVDPVNPGNYIAGVPMHY